MNYVKPALYVLGGLAVLAGLLWLGQGTGLISWPRSSFMINQRPWAYRGGELALAGACILYISRRL